MKIFAKAVALAMLAGCVTAPPVPRVAATANAACDTLLVVEKGDATLSAFDITSKALLWRAPAGAEAHEVAVLSELGRAYVSHYGGPGSDQHTLAVIDLRTGKALRDVDIAPLRSPHGLLAREGKIYFTAETSKVVGRWDPASSRVDWIVGLGTDRSHMLIGLPDGGIATANSDSGSVSIISPIITTFAGGSPRPNWKVETVVTGAGTQGIDITPDGRFVWASAARDGLVKVIDLRSRSVVGSVVLPWKAGNRLKITHDGNTVLIAGDELLAIDVSTKAIKRLAVGHSRAEGLLVPPGDGGVVFVAIPQDNRVVSVRVADLTIASSITTGALPDGLACFKRN